MRPWRAWTPVPDVGRQQDPRADQPHTPLVWAAYVLWPEPRYRLCASNRVFPVVWARWQIGSCAIAAIAAGFTVTAWTRRGPGLRLLDAGWSWYAAQSAVWHANRQYRGRNASNAGSVTPMPSGSPRRPTPTRRRLDPGPFGRAWLELVRPRRIAARSDREP